MSTGNARELLNSTDNRQVQNTVRKKRKLNHIFLFITIGGKLLK